MTSKNKNQTAPIKRLAAIAVIALMIQGCAGRPQYPTDTGDRDQYIDSHFHISNYAVQGLPLKVLIDQYMGDEVLRSTAMTLPLQQKWDPFEHYADDRIAPNYYLGSKAELYYYSFVDALLAKEFLKLSAADKARIDPMITGFNPMDRYAVQHIKRVLLTFPGVFSGLGEFTVHKEIVSDKIAGDPIRAVSRDAVPDDVSDGGKLTLYSQALESILDFAAESGLVVVLHSDLYNAKVSYDGSHTEVLQAVPFREGLKHLCSSSPKAKLVWAHTGLGRFVTPPPNHLDTVSAILDACPNWNVDISWDLVQAYIVTPKPGMPSLAQWSRFVRKYQDRVLWGSDTVIHTKNKIDDRGHVTVGARMPVQDYRAVLEIAEPLWEALGPEVSHKVRIANHERLFDAARAQVRAWEQRHAQDDVWNLPPQ